MNSPETALDNSSAHGSTVTPQPTAYEWIKPEHLPPVGCPLVINVDGAAVHAERTNHLTDKAGQMEYLLQSCDIISGRFEWSYP